MKLKPEFITHETNGETVLIDVTGEIFSGMIRCNRTAAFIVKCLSEETAETELEEKMLAEFSGASLSDVKDDISKVLSALRSAGAVDD